MPLNWKHLLTLPLALFLLMTTGCAIKNTRTSEPQDPDTPRTQVVKLPWVKPKPDHVTGLDLSLLDRYQKKDPPTTYSSPYEYPDVDGLSLSILGDHLKTQRGVQLEAITGNTYSLHGIKISGLVSGYRELTGLGISGLANSYAGSYSKKDSVKGGQIAAWSNVFGGPVKGFQTSIIYNDCTSLSGGQICGLCNVAEDIDGTQISCLSNVSGRTNHGAQVGGLSNFATGDNKGCQLAIIHSNCTNQYGAQVSGLYNFTNGTNSGVQIGLINKSMLLKNGVQVGLINYTHNGILPVLPFFNYGKYDENELHKLALTHKSPRTRETAIRALKNKQLLQDIVMNGQTVPEQEVALSSISDPPILCQTAMNHPSMEMRRKAFQSLEPGTLETIAENYPDPAVSLAARIKIGTMVKIDSFTWDQAFASYPPGTVIHALTLTDSRLLDDQKGCEFLMAHRDDILKPCDAEISVLTEVLLRYECVGLANIFLSSEQPNLEEAARQWAESSDYYTLTMKDGRELIIPTYIDESELLPTWKRP